MEIPVLPARPVRPRRRQVVHVEATRCDVGGDEELEVLDAELLHDVVALCLAQFAVEGVGVVAILDKFVSNFLRLLAGTTEDDAVDIGVEVHDALEGKVFVLRTNHVVDVADILVALVLTADDYLLGSLHILLGDSGDALRHSSREEEHVAVGRDSGEDGVDTLREAHVEHLVGLVHDYVADGGEVHRLALHEVEETARGSHHDVHAPLEGLNLALDAGAAIDRQHLEAVDVLGILGEVVGDLETQLTRGTED